MFVNSDQEQHTSSYLVGLDHMQITGVLCSTSLFNPKCMIHYATYR
jgi:hypothetical protein